MLVILLDIGILLLLRIILSDDVFALCNHIMYRARGGIRVIVMSF